MDQLKNDIKAIVNEKVSNDIHERISGILTRLTNRHWIPQDRLENTIKNFVSDNIDPTILIDTIEELIETEYKSIANDKTNQLLHHISKKHNIKMKFIVQDMQATGFATETCLGVNEKGVRCNLSGKYNGFCKRHRDQKVEVCERPREQKVEAGEPVIDTSGKLEHNHDRPPMFKLGCPACEALLK